MSEKIYRVQMNGKGMPNFSTAVEIDTDISDYSDKLWRNAYERGKADRPQGEWIDKGDYAECSNCGANSGTQFDGVEPVPRKTKFCPNCGARMKGIVDEEKVDWENFYQILRECQKERNE